MEGVLSLLIQKSWVFVELFITWCWVHVDKLEISSETVHSWPLMWRTYLALMVN